MEMPGRKANTFSDLLRLRSTNHENRRAYIFLRDGEQEESTLTFGELNRRATIVAEHLLERCKPGDRVILLYPQGLEFIITFFGCLLSGVIPVPVSVPSRQRGFEIVRGIANDSGATCVLSTTALITKFGSVFDGDGGRRLDWLNTDHWSHAPGTNRSFPTSMASDVALLQYTSGSTGTPRGVVVTHGNLVDNHRQLEQSFRHDETTSILSWLPMFHDMGLGTVLGALWLGVSCTLMAPTAFLQKPVRWLRAISRYRATSSGGPDFAYDLCVRRIGRDECEGLDLSSWSVAYNGSEPVRASTMSRFVEAFGPYGFRRDAFYPVYGLAEATLFVTGGHAREEPLVRKFSREGLEAGEGRIDASDKGKALVGCGSPWLDSRLCVVNPETAEPCRPGQIGEIWVAGPSVAAGYWQKPRETAEVFGARTHAGDGPFLRTGDLGFQHQDHLFVTGRYKDLIIIRGRNHYPQDIETSVSESHPALEPLAAAAFSVESEDGEQLVVVQEVKRSAVQRLDPEPVFRAIRSVVAEQHGVHTHAIVLLGPGNLPRTTSGKVRRKACRRAFLENGLPVLSASVFGAESIEASIAPPPADPAGMPLIAPHSPGQTNDTARVAALAARSAKADGLIDWLRRYADGSHEPSGSDVLSTITPRILKDLAGQGLLAMQVEEQYGGLGLGHGDTARVLEQLAAIDLNAGLFVGLNNYLGVAPLVLHGTPRLKSAVLGRLTHGGELAAFALAEPGLTGNPDLLAAYAEPINGSGFKLFGTKYASGGLQNGGVINVFARHSDREGVTAFVVPQNAEGLSLTGEALVPDTHGLTRNQIVLDGVAVNNSHVLGRVGQGAAIALEAMSHARLAVAAACLGGMKRCAQLVFHYSTQRQSGTGRLVAHPVTLAKLGRVTAGIAALEALIQQVALAADRRASIPTEAFTVCKMVAPEMLWEAVDDLVQLLGRRGYVETPHIRHLVRDAQALRSCEGPAEAMSSLLGARLLNGGEHAITELVADVLEAPKVGPLVAQAVQAARARITKVAANGQRDAMHWIHLRAGELTTWITLLAAVEGRRKLASSSDLDRAASWAQTNIELTLALLQSDSPLEVEGAEISGSVAAYSRSIGNSDPLSIWQQMLHPLVSPQDVEPGEPAAPVSHSPLISASEGAQRAKTPPAPPMSDKRGQGLQTWIVTWLSRRLRVAPSQIDPKRSFADHGVDSLAAVELAKALSDHLGRPLDETLLWNFATIDALIQFLDPSAQAPELKRPPSAAPSDRTPRRGAETATQAELEEAIDQLEKELRRRS